MCAHIPSLVCVYGCVCTCVHTHTSSVSIRVHVCAFMYALYVCAYTDDAYVCTYIMCAHIHAFMCVSVYMSMCALHWGCLALWAPSFILVYIHRACVFCTYIMCVHIHACMCVCMTVGITLRLSCPVNTVLHCWGRLALWAPSFILGYIHRACVFCTYIMCVHIHACMCVCMTVGITLRLSCPVNTVLHCCAQPVTVYTENKLPFPIRVQLLDSSGSPSATADIRVHITKDPKIKVTAFPYRHMPSVCLTSVFVITLLPVACPTSVFIIPLQSVLDCVNDKSAINSVKRVC